MVQTRRLILQLEYTGRENLVAVANMWSEFSEVCDYIRFGTVPEANKIFSNFSHI